MSSIDPIPKAVAQFLKSVLQSEQDQLQQDAMERLEEAFARLADVFKNIAAASASEEEIRDAMAIMQELRERERREHERSYWDTPRSITPTVRPRLTPPWYTGHRPRSTC